MQGLHIRCLYQYWCQGIPISLVLCNSCFAAASPKHNNHVGLELNWNQQSESETLCEYPGHTSARTDFSSSTPTSCCLCEQLAPRNLELAAKQWINSRIEANTLCINTDLDSDKCIWHSTINWPRHRLLSLFLNNQATFAAGPTPQEFFLANCCGQDSSQIIQASVQRMAESPQGSLDLRGVGGRQMLSILHLFSEAQRAYFSLCPILWMWHRHPLNGHTSVHIHKSVMWVSFPFWIFCKISWSAVFTRQAQGSEWMVLIIYI